MLYNGEEKQLMLDTLENRISSIIDVCIALVEEGYTPNKNKYTKLSWTTIMLDACNNMDVLSSEQHIKIENLFNKVMML